MKTIIHQQITGSNKPEMNTQLIKTTFIHCLNIKIRKHVFIVHIFLSNLALF